MTMHNECTLAPDRASFGTTGPDEQHRPTCQHVLCSPPSVLPAPAPPTHSRWTRRAAWSNRPACPLLNPACFACSCPHLLTAAGPEERHGEHPRRRRPGAGGRAGPVLAGAAGAVIFASEHADVLLVRELLPVVLPQFSPEQPGDLNRPTETQRELLPTSALKCTVCCSSSSLTCSCRCLPSPLLPCEQEQLEEMRADASLYDKMAASVAPNVSTVSLLWCLCCVPIKVLCWCTSCLPCWPAALLTCRSLH